MNNNREENNSIFIAGKVVEDFTFSYESHGEKFYSSKVEIKRLNDITDILPILVSEKLLDDKIINSSYIIANGQIRTRGIQKSSKFSKSIYVFIQTISSAEKSEINTLKDCNKVTLKGHLCKKPSLRQSKTRTLSDIMLAVNRTHSTSYIPCIAWSRNAIHANKLEIGDLISIEGRFQQREYKKDDKSYFIYEVSVNKLNEE